MDNTRRFSNRVDDYVKYRPGYPAAIITFLEDKYGLTREMLIADIGAGTGISSELFLQQGYRVVAVEPNKEMREKSVELLGHYEGFIVVDGTAEHTGLEDNSVDMILSGQAFHWFDQASARAEFNRIAGDKKIVALLWNERLTNTDFEKEYDAFIVQHGKDYVQVDHRNISEQQIATFFSPAAIELTVFANEQVFDREGLQGRLLSSSYMPAKDEEGYATMIDGLDVLFNKHQQRGKITIHYATKLFVGRLAG